MISSNFVVASVFTLSYLLSQPRIQTQIRSFLQQAFFLTNLQTCALSVNEFEVM